MASPIYGGNNPYMVQTGWYTGGAYAVGQVQQTFQPQYGGPAGVPPGAGFNPLALLSQLAPQLSFGGDPSSMWGMLQCFPQQGGGYGGFPSFPAYPLAPPPPPYPPVYPMPPQYGGIPYGSPPCFPYPQPAPPPPPCHCHTEPVKLEARIDALDKASNKAWDAVSNQDTWKKAGITPNDLKGIKSRAEADALKMVHGNKNDPLYGEAVYISQANELANYAEGKLTGNIDNLTIGQVKALSSIDHSGTEYVRLRDRFLTLSAQQSEHATA